MDAQEVKVKAATNSQKSPLPQGGFDALKARRSVQSALRAVSSRLKSERVQLALLVSDQEALVMIQGQVQEGRLEDFTNRVLTLTSSLV